MQSYCAKSANACLYRQLQKSHVFCVDKEKDFQYLPEDKESMLFMWKMYNVMYDMFHYCSQASLLHHFLQHCQPPQDPNNQEPSGAQLIPGELCVHQHHHQL